MDKLCIDVISIPVKNYIIASIGILNVNFCEFLYINFYGYYKNFIITLILTCFFFF